MKIFEQRTYWRPPSPAVIKALAAATIVAGFLAYAGASIGLLTRANFEHERGLLGVVYAPVVILITRIYNDSRSDLLITGIVCLTFSLIYKATPAIHETGYYSSAVSVFYPLPAALVASIASVRPVDEKRRALRQSLLLGLCTNLCILAAFAIFSAFENGLFD